MLPPSTLVKTAERLLHEVKNGTHPNSHSYTGNDSSSSSGFNYVAFWIINSVVLVMIFSLAVWCFKFGGAEFVVRCASRVSNPRNNSDIEYARRVLERQRQREEKEKETPEERRAKLDESFERCKASMVVEEKDFVKDPSTETPNDIETGSAANNETPNDVETGSAPKDDNQEDTLSVESCMDVTNNINDDTMSSACGDGYLMIQPESSGPRTVPNCCAVCICPYEAGETVVWSAYKDCQHAFHKDCVVDWFIKMQKGTPCPCCRQEFTDLVEFERKQKQKKEKHFSNFGVISIR